MSRAHQAFHPSEAGKLVPASTGGERSSVWPSGGECRAAISAIPFIILLMVSVVRRALVISDVRVDIQKTRAFEFVDDSVRN